jgi:hypothetical protein
MIFGGGELLVDTACKNLQGCRMGGSYTRVGVAEFWVDQSFVSHQHHAWIKCTAVRSVKQVDVILG